MIDLVQMFHLKFGLPDGNADTLITGTAEGAEAAEYRVKFLQEELDELVEAINDGDRVKAFDALIDLVYVAHGTALFMGVSPGKWAAGMEAVHAANMQKERAQKKGDSKRGSTFDVIKPRGWTGPEAKLTGNLASKAVSLLLTNNSKP